MSRTKDLENEVSEYYCDICLYSFHVNGIITHINSCEKKFNEKSQVKQIIIDEMKVNKIKRMSEYYQRNKEFLKRRSTCRSYFNNAFSFSISRSGDNRSDYQLLKNRKGMF